MPSTSDPKMSGSGSRGRLTRSRRDRRCSYGRITGATTVPCYPATRPERMRSASHLQRQSNPSAASRAVVRPNSQRRARHDARRESQGLAVAVRRPTKRYPDSGVACPTRATASRRRSAPGPVGSAPGKRGDRPPDGSRDSHRDTTGSEPPSPRGMPSLGDSVPLQTTPLSGSVTDWILPVTALVEQSSGVAGRRPRRRMVTPAKGSSPGARRSRPRRAPPGWPPAQGVTALHRSVRPAVGMLPPTHWSR
jgi:hypothetical protein